MNSTNVTQTYCVIGHILTLHEKDTEDYLPIDRDSITPKMAPLAVGHAFIMHKCLY